jgi:hypothetical protein
VATASQPHIPPLRPKHSYIPVLRSELMTVNHTSSSLDERSIRDVTTE